MPIKSDPNTPPPHFESYLFFSMTFGSKLDKLPCRLRAFGSITSRCKDFGLANRDESRKLEFVPGSLANGLGFNDNFRVTGGTWSEVDVDEFSEFDEECGE